MKNGAMLNAYPDSLGKNLGETAAFLARPEMKDAFRNFYILPSVFNTDLDHGFSVISYDLCDELAKKGLVISGLSPDGRLTEMVELAGHPWFVATQAHPEFKSRPGRPHPLFRDFIAAAIR